MFLGMSMALPLHMLVTTLQKKSSHNYLVIEPNPLTPKSMFTMKHAKILLVPTLFDLLGTALSKIGLMYCTVSIFQLVRTSIMIIISLIKCLGLGEKMQIHLSFLDWWS